jgi:hypothetical protein
MVGRRITFAFLVGCLATSVAAAERSASFGVSVRVVAPLRVRTGPAPAATTAPTSGTAGRTGSAPAILVAAPATGGSAIPTVLPDGAPTAIVER